MQGRPEPCLKMDDLNSLFCSLTVNGGPDISFLRAEREVVCLLITFFLGGGVPYSLFHIQTAQPSVALLPSGDPQSLFRRH